MLNYVLTLFQNPKKGWDPIPLGYAEDYTKWSYENMDYSMIAELEAHTNGLKDKKLIDLGGGPGQYSIAFAKRGAQVTWLDVSNNYLNIVKAAAEKENVKLDYVIDYMDFAKGEFDILFNRVCWYYCLNDVSFMKKIYNLVKHNGYGYLILHDENLTERYNNYGTVKKWISKFLFLLNDKTGIKIGHPVPSFKRIKKIFSQYHYRSFSVERRGKDLVYIKFQK